MNSAPTIKTKSTADSSFRETYNKTIADTSDLTAVILKCRQKFSRVTYIPTKTKIIDFTPYPRPSFGRNKVEQDALSFYESTLAAAEFFSLISQEGADKTISSTRSALQEEWSECTRCPNFQKLLCAGFGICFNDDEFLTKYLTSETLTFLSENVIQQSLFASTKSFQLALEVYGKVFIMQILKQCVSRINTFTDNEENKESFKLLQAFYRLFSVVAHMRKETDFCRCFQVEANDILNFSLDFKNPYEATNYVSALAAIAVDAELANWVYSQLEHSKSEVINLYRFMYAIRDHPSLDLAGGDVDRLQLSADDSRILEAILEMIAAMCRKSGQCRRNITGNDFKFIESVVNLVLCPVPATLKARCYDALAALVAPEDPLKEDLAEDRKIRIEVWGQFIQSKVLTEEILDQGTGGIISDVDITENEERTYPMLRSFVQFLACLLRTPETVKPDQIEIIHTYLLEQVLLKVQTRPYAFNIEKWMVACNAAQAFTEISKLEMERALPFFRTAFCDQKFVKEFVTLAKEEDAPIPALLSIFRLFYLVSIRDAEFRSVMDGADHSSYAALTRQISWSSECLKKIITCIGENDHDLNLVCIALARLLALDSDVAQVVFSGSGCIARFCYVLSKDEPEPHPTKEDEYYDGAQEYDLKENVRVQLLEFLVSLGSTSHFVRHICGYDTSDPPSSLLRSSLEHGILPTLLKKLGDSNNIYKYPAFMGAALTIMLQLCEHSFTISPLLNLLRGSSTSFFEKQFRNLQTREISLRAIGSFLKIVAREATESDEKQSSGKTLVEFEILLEANGFVQDREHVVLALEFLDRIDESDEAASVAEGLFDAITALLMNESVRKAMIEHPDKWRDTWICFMGMAMEKASVVKNPVTADALTQCVGLIASMVFAEAMLGPVDPSDVLQLLETALSALISFGELGNPDAGMGIYVMIASMFSGVNPIERNEELDKARLVLARPEFANAAAMEMETKLPIAKAAVFAAIESVVQLIPNSLDEFMSAAVNQLLDDWADFDKSQEAGSYVIRSKFSMFARFIATSDSRDVLNKAGLVKKCAHAEFWGGIAEAYSTCAALTESEAALTTGASILRAISALVAAFPSSKELFTEVYQFLNDFEGVFAGVLNFGGLFTLTALRFIAELGTLLALMMPDPQSPLGQSVKKAVARFGGDRWREFLRKRAGYAEKIPSQKTYAEAVEIVRRIVKVLQHSIDYK